MALDRGIRMRRLLLAMVLLLLPHVSAARADAASEVQECQQPEYGTKGTPSWAAGLPEPVATSVTVSDHEVPGADGTLLFARVYLPDASAGPLPTVFELSPYGHYAFSPYGRERETVGLRERTDGTVGSQSCDAAFWLRRGYAVVVADARGTGNSGGCVDWGGLHDQRDGAALVSWIAAQRWSDGAVGMVGFSWPGALSLATAVQAPEALRAVVAGSPTPWHHNFHAGGTLREFGVLAPAALLAMVEGSPPSHVGQPGHLSAVGGAGCNAESLPELSSSDGTLGAWWRERHVPAHAHRITAPVLLSVGDARDNIGGFGPLWEALEQAGVTRRGVVGPWPHGTPPHDIVPFWPLHQLRWMEHWVRGNDTGVTREPPSTLYDQDGEQQTAERFTPRNQTLYIGQGELRTAPPGRGEVIYRALPGATREVVHATPSARVVSRTEPLAGPLRLSGVPRLHLHAAMDRTDANFAALLYDVSPQGERRLVTYGYLDARHRTGVHFPPQDVTPGVVERYRVDLDLTEYTLAAGHRLELVIASDDTAGQRAMECGVLYAPWCEDAGNGLVTDGSAAAVTVMEGPGATRLALPVAELSGGSGVAP